MRYATLPPRPEGVEVHHYASEIEWFNGVRRKDVTASSAAVLFSGQVDSVAFSRVDGLEHPYTTLQDVMSALVEPSRRKSREGGYLSAGSVLEPAVAEYLRRERPEWDVRRVHGPGERLYLRDPSVRLGFTMEPWVSEDETGIYVNEYKTASFTEFETKGWPVGVPGFTYVQGAVACCLAGAAGCVFVCMQRSSFGLGKLAMHKVPRERFEGLYMEVRSRAAALARMVDEVRARNASVAARKGLR